MNKKEDGFELFYNEFKDWTKKQLLHRTYDIILKDTEEIGEKDKEIDRLNNELSIKTTYIEDLLKLILKSKDFELQKEIYEHGIEYDKKLKELKEGK